MKYKKTIPFVIILLLVIGAALITFHNIKHKPASKKSVATATTGAYAGWNSYTLKNEKLSFHYPKAWHLRDTSSKSYDTVTLTGTQGFQATIATVSSPQSVPAGATIIHTAPAVLAGQTVYFDYLSTSPGTSTQVNQVCVSTSKTDASALPVAQHILNAYVMACAGYTQAGQSETLAQMASDTNYTEGGKIIASMHY